MNFYLIHCVLCLPGFPQWVTLLHHQYQLTCRPSTGSLSTCMRLSKSSRIKQSILSLMANTNLVKTKTSLELYLIDLAQGHMVFMMSLNSVQENPRQMSNMYSMHSRLTSSQHSLFFRAGINLADNTLVHSSLKQTLC